MLSRDLVGPCVAIDTETTGLHAIHGCRPFLVSACREEDTEAGYSTRLWRWQIDLKTRQPTTQTKNRLTDLKELAAYCKGHNAVFFNAPFDLTMLAMAGCYFSFRDVGGLSWSTLTLRKHARFRCFPAPLVHVECNGLHDTSLLCHARDCRRPKAPAGLKDACLYYLGIPEDDQRALLRRVKHCRTAARKLGYAEGTNPAGKWEPESDYWLPAAMGESGADADYAVQDAVRTLRLFFFLYHYRAANNDAGWQGYRRNVSTLPATCLMQVQGIRLDRTQFDPNNKTGVVSNLTAQYKAKQKTINDWIAKAYDRPGFNVQSTQQLASVLHCPPPYGLGLPCIKLTEKGLPSTDKEAMQGLILWLEQGQPRNFKKTVSPECDCLGRDYSQLTCDTSNSFRLLDEITTYEMKEGFRKDNVGFRSYHTGVKYATNYLQAATPPDNPFSFREWKTPAEERHPGKELYLFPTYNTVGTVTMRYASRNPNGQNVTKRPEIPLRKLFVPSPGKVFLAIDYSQLELRLFAVASQDPHLLAAFAEGVDIHHATACRMYGYKLTDKVPSHLRRRAKNVNFGIIYGAGPDKIEQQTGDATAFEAYKKNFPQASKFMHDTITQVRETGEVDTLFGYPLRVWPDGEHKGVNCIIQGTAGELIKLAMADLQLDWERTRLLLNVHDELVFEVDDDPDWVDEQADYISHVMESQGQRINAYTPVDVEVCAESWAAGISLEEYLCATH